MYGTLFPPDLGKENNAHHRLPAHVVYTKKDNSFESRIANGFLNQFWRARQRTKKFFLIRTTTHVSRRRRFWPDYVGMPVLCTPVASTGYQVWTRPTARLRPGNAIYDAHGKSPDGTIIVITIRDPLPRLPSIPLPPLGCCTVYTLVRRCRPLLCLIFPGVHYGIGNKREFPCLRDNSCPSRHQSGFPLCFKRTHFFPATLLSKPSLCDLPDCLNWRV